MSFNTRPMKWSHCPEDGPLSDEAMEIEIINEGSGEFVTLYQDASTKNGLVAITLEEWPTLRDAIDAAFAEIDNHQDTP